LTHFGMLAYLRDRFYVPPENLATEALSYLLNRHEHARDGLNRFIQSVDKTFPNLVGFDTQGTSLTDSGIPDLLGRDEKGIVRFLGEVKFDAGLTPNQPVTYLERLDEVDAPTMLMFIVPGIRLETVWSEVLRRSTDAGISLGESSAFGDKVIYARSQQRVLGIASWRHVLKAIESNLEEANDPAALADFHQLKSLCDQQETMAFRPLAIDDLDGQRGQRIVDLVRILGDFESTIRTEGIASTEGLNEVNTREWLGRYVAMNGWIGFIGLCWKHWAAFRPTPMWLYINDTHAKDYQPLVEALEPLTRKSPSRLLFDNHFPLIPLYIKDGVDLDQVVDDLAKQLHEIAELMQQCPHPIREKESAP
jgi:hypothetical protein